MAVKKRGAIWHIRFRPFGDKQIWISTGCQRKSQAESIEREIMIACRSQDYRMLTPEARSCCVQMFKNQQWKIPSDLVGEEPVKETLNLWKGIELTLKYPEVAHSPNRERHEQAFVHVVNYFGKEFPIESLWIPQVKAYQLERLNQGAAASTVNKERAALSKMFEVLIELGFHDRNPVRMVKGLSERDGRREVYISWADFNAIIENLPSWVKPIVQTLYMTGMRRGEALSLAWENVNLESRIIRLHAHQTKERNDKRVPICRQLVPILEAVGKVRSISTDKVFLTNRGQPPFPDSLTNPWRKAVKKVGLEPRPTIHDLRHVFKVNCMRSGIDFEIRETILGHSRGIAGRYGRISDADLVRAVDSLQFGEGKTEIWLARQK